MAKPMPVPYAKSPRRQENNQDTSPSARRRRPQQRAPSLSPSPTVLSLLATVVASSTPACASPTPLSFLCPSLGFEGRQAPPKPTPAAVLPPSLHKRSKGRPGNSSKVRRIPDKFQYDSETGYWKRVESWTLYGSTVCPSCPQASGSMSVDDQIQAPTITSTPTPTSVNGSATPSDYDIRDTLPPGWYTEKKTTSGTRTTWILVGSLVLAAAILFLTITSLFWRKNQHRKKRKDLEMKTRRRTSTMSTDDEEANTELINIREAKGAKTKHRLWAKATARWKAHAHYSARQRRGKRVAVSRQNDLRSSAVSLAPIEHPVEPSTPSVVPSNLIARRSSLESMYMDDPGPPQATTSSTSPPHPSHTDSSTGRQLSRPSFSSDSVSISIPAPPAYRQRPHPRSPPTPPSSHPLDTESNANSSHFNRSSLASYSSSDPNPDHPLRQNHVAHVATDDKTLLARLVDLASAPLADGPSNRETTSELEASVPEWQDEQLEDFGETENTLTSYQSLGSSSNAPLFPPLPSKGKMAEAGYFDHEYELQEPSSEPYVAPPFEVDDQADQVSYPPLDDMSMAPSAPPLPEEPDSTSVPSAPPLPDWANESDIEEDQVSTTQGVAAVSLEQTDTPRPSSPVSGPVASDGTPPCYHT